MEKYCTSALYIYTLPNQKVCMSTLADLSTWHHWVITRLQVMSPWLWTPPHDWVRGTLKERRADWKSKPGYSPMTPPHRYIKRDKTGLSSSLPQHTLIALITVLLLIVDLFTTLFLCIRLSLAHYPYSIIALLFASRNTCVHVQTRKSRGLISRQRWWAQRISLCTWFNSWNVIFCSRRAGGFKQSQGFLVWGDWALSARQGKRPAGLLLLSARYYSVRQAPSRITVAMVTPRTGGRIRFGMPGWKKKRALVWKWKVCVGEPLWNLVGQETWENVCAFWHETPSSRYHIRYLSWVCVLIHIQKRNGNTITALHKTCMCMC